MPDTMERVEFDTSRFGRLTVEPEQVWHFPSGLIGLPGCQRFVRLAFDDPAMPFEWLQSLDEPTVAFLLANPTDFFADYVVNVHPEELASIDLQQEADGDLRTLVTVTDNLAEMTTNLLGPLVFNTKTRMGKQLVLPDARYQTKHRLFPQARSHAGPSSPSE